MLAAKAGGIAGLVRVSGPGSILAALDMGAAGVVVPHVNSGAEAKQAVAAARYAGGSRGFSPSPRAGRYGALSLADHVAQADTAASVTIMIEHPDALRNLETIAAIQGIDALFLGLGDLTVAMGESTAETPALRRAAAEICLTAQRHGKALMATAPDVAAAAWLLDLGVSTLVVGSDQGLLRKAAAQQLHAFRSLPPREMAP
jgi:2-keto-3-deoxy-L-rhamnonate aldolase RhmA